MMKVHHGTVDWNIADMVRTPWRMTPLFSASRPISEAGAIAEVDDRQMEGLGKVDEARDLLAGVGPSSPPP